MEIEHLIIAKIALEMRAYCSRADTGRSAGKYQVAGLECTETAHISDNLVNNADEFFS